MNNCHGRRKHATILLTTTLVLLGSFLSILWSLDASKTFVVNISDEAYSSPLVAYNSYNQTSFWSSSPPLPSTAPHYRQGSEQENSASFTSNEKEEDPALTSLLQPNETDNNVELSTTNNASTTNRSEEADNVNKEGSWSRQNKKKRSVPATNSNENDNDNDNTTITQYPADTRSNVTGGITRTIRSRQNRRAKQRRSGATNTVARTNNQHYNYTNNTTSVPFQLWPVQKAINRTTHKNHRPSSSTELFRLREDWNSSTNAIHRDNFTFTTSQWLTQEINLASVQELSCGWVKCFARSHSDPTVGWLFAEDAIYREQYMTPPSKKSSSKDKKNKKKKKTISTNIDSNYNNSNTNTTMRVSVSQGMIQGYWLSQDLEAKYGIQHFNLDPPLILQALSQSEQALVESKLPSREVNGYINITTHNPLVVQRIRLAPVDHFVVKCNVHVRYLKQLNYVLRSKLRSKRKTMMDELQTFAENFVAGLNATIQILQDVPAFVRDFQFLVDNDNGKIYHLDFDRVYQFPVGILDGNGTKEKCRSSLQVYTNRVSHFAANRLMKEKQRLLLLVVAKSNSSSIV